MKILIRTDDRIGERMAGSALRAWEIARALEYYGYEVQIEAASGSSSPGPGPKIRESASRFRHRVLIVPPWSLRASDFFRPHRLIIDGVTPLPTELAMFPQTEMIKTRSRRARSRIPLALARADALLVAGKAQRRCWLEILGSRRPELPIIDVPFGVPEQPPGEEIEEIPGVPPGNAVILWWGGVWPWLDLETLLAARALLGRRKLSLVVPVAGRPGNSGTVFSEDDLLHAKKRHSLRGSEVVALKTWVPYQKRDRVLNRASVLAFLHQSGREAELSFRTRAMDALWAGVPMLLSEGGEVAELARRNGWGSVVRPGDVASTAAALDFLLRDSYHFSCREALEKSRPHWTWRRLLQPVADLLPRLPMCRREALTSSSWRAIRIFMSDNEKNGWC